jgi:hypothetical protein
MLAMVVNSVAICKNRADAMKGKSGGRGLVQVGARHLVAIDIYIREHTNLTDDAIGSLADCTDTHNKTR